MRKKFLSALLLGLFAVASTSTFVSCKDYNDDINNLQSQISSLNDLVSQKETAIKGEIATLNGSLTALNTALSGKITEGDAATLAAAKAAVTEAKTALENAINPKISNLETKSALQDDAILKAQATADNAIKILADKADKTEVNKISGDLTKVSTDLSTLTTKFGTLEQTVAKNVTGIATLSSALNSQVAALETKITTGDNNTLNEAVKKMNALETKINNAFAAADTKVLNDAKAEITKVKGELETAYKNADVKTLNDAKAAIATAKSECLAADATLKTDILNQVNTILKDYVTVTTFGELKTAHATTASKVQTLETTTIPALNSSITTLGTTISGIDAKFDIISKCLAKNLRSLVFIPNLYMDGIETIEYPFLVDTTLILEPNPTTWKRTARVANTFAPASAETTDKNVTINGLWANSALQAVNVNYEILPGSVEFVYGPTWKVQYHMNPSVSDTKYADVKGFLNREVEVITRSTTLGNITSPELMSDGKTKAFSNANGVLTVGLQIQNPKFLLENGPKAVKGGQTGNISKGVDNIVALQVNSKNGEKDTLVTSDYAMLYGEKVWIDGLIWNLNPKVLRDENRHKQTDVCHEKVHVWDTPVEALNHPADVQLGYNANQVDLGKMLGIHYVQESLTKSAKCVGTWSWGQEAEWGLYYEFVLVDYSVDGNKTHDSRYATLVDDKAGSIKALNIKEDGVTYADQSATSVGREPLVRVLVKRGNPEARTANDPVVLDGYILLHITKENPAEPTRGNKTIKKWHNEDTYAFCNDKTILETNWSQFSYWVLTEELENMTKDQFDEQYEMDLKSATELGTNGDGNKYYSAKIFSDDKGTEINYATALRGIVEYTPNADGETNHTFIWKLTPTELEDWNHEKDPGTKTNKKYYIRYKAKTASAKYSYIYIEMDVTLIRPAISEHTWGTKNTNYWFKETGEDDGLEAVALNTLYPENGGSTYVWNRAILNSIVGNETQFNAAVAAANRKFFFVPQDVVVTDEYTGEKWTITPRSGKNDPKRLDTDKYNNMYCLYIANNAHEYKANDASKNEEILKQCAIDYSKGVYNNLKLYATKDVNAAEYTQIATMTVNGQINLEHNAAAHAVVNAVGYMANHAMLNKELRSYVGVIARNSCNQAVIVKDNQFLASWERPINPETFGDEVYDAENNGEYVYVVDILKIFDWRGPVSGKMYGDNQWLWAYYNIKSITIDCTPANVKTNMHQTDKTKRVALNTISSQVHLYACDPTTGAKNQSQVYNFDLSAYNSADKNDLIREAMGISPVSTANKSKFGVIFYENNGGNVEDFIVDIPATITYEWGTIKTTISLTVKRTLGNAKK